MIKYCDWCGREFLYQGTLIQVCSNVCFRLLMEWSQTGPFWEHEE